MEKFSFLLKLLLDDLFGRVITNANPKIQPVFFMHILERSSLVIVLMASLGIVSCNKDSQHGGQQAGAVDVYVAGHIVTTGKNIAIYWKNENYFLLSDGTKDAQGVSIAVSGNDVYVVGTETDFVNFNFSAHAICWKNGNAIYLNEEGSSYSFATSVAVSGNDVYIAGYKSNGSPSVPVYWKNGIPINLDGGLIQGYANAITVSGNNVYVAGNELDNFSGSPRVAKYWKNGIAYPLTDGSTLADAVSIAVSGKDVYVLGYQADKNGYRVPMYWKNGTAVPFGDGNVTVVNSIAVSGNSVLVAGASYNDFSLTSLTAKYWMNGLPHELTKVNNSLANSIAIYGNDIYSVGTGGNDNVNINRRGLATLWRNGESFELPGQANAFLGIAHSIFIERRNARQEPHKY